MKGLLVADEATSLEQLIGYRFRRPEWLRQALTHRSHSEESSGKEPSNEQMEFLGDAILGFLVSEALLHRFPESREGFLSKLKARLVSGAHLHRVAEELELGGFLRLRHGEIRTWAILDVAPLAILIEEWPTALRHGLELLDGLVAINRHWIHAGELNGSGATREAGKAREAAQTVR